MSSFLPPNATAQERALEATLARLGDVPVDLRGLWNPDTCPAAFLPWLAWAFSVDEWVPTWPESTKRQVIKDSYSVHAKKGSVASVKEALAAAGFGDATIVEGTANSWAEYTVALTTAITNEQADEVRRILAAVAPARCHLVGLVFPLAANLYDGEITYDGTFNYGAG